jgi:Bacterial regulatory proteins, luxR family
MIFQRSPNSQYHFSYVFPLEVVFWVIDEYNLTNEQAEVMDALCKGRSIKSLSDELRVSKGAIEHRLTEVYKKINKKEKLKDNKQVFGQNGRKKEIMGRWLLKQEIKLQAHKINKYKDNEIKTMVEEIVENRCSQVQSENISSFCISDEDGNLYDLETKEKIHLKEIIEEQYGSLKELTSSEILNLLMHGHEIIISVFSRNQIEKLKESSEYNILNKNLQTLSEQDIPDS